MNTLIKNIIKDKKVEPFARWLVKWSRGIHMPFDLVKNEIYDRQAVEVIERVLKKDSNCIDVGCHEGQFLKHFMKSAPQGSYYAFEPIPKLAASLADQFPSVHVFPYALSNESGEAIFYVIPESPALSGLDRRDFLAPAKSRDEIKVRVERLDDIIPLDVNIDIIKIDVEGAEGLVISGGIETIRRNAPYIILEHGSLSSAAFGISSSDIYDLLTGHCGLKLSLLPSWLNGRAVLTKQEFIAADEWYFLAHPAYQA